MCTPEVPAKPQGTLRNGLDFVPKKTYPPDYSNVPDVRSWQMSPFSQERFDLNEIQIMEKKGIKFRDQLEALKKKFKPPKKEETKVERTPKCPKCAEREKAEAACDVNYLYQPYGPSVLSTVSYRNVGIKKNKVFCVSPPVYSDFKVNRKKPEYLKTPFSCQGFGAIESSLKNSKGYTPYGPTSKRFTSFNYEPMGPTLRPVRH